jgi:DNA-binding Lrp family transcriptional regulator
MRLGYQTFCLLFEKDAFAVPIERPAFAVPIERLSHTSQAILRQVEQEPETYFHIVWSEHVFGGKVDRIAVIQCVDKEVMSTHVIEIADRLRRAEAPAIIQWKWLAGLYTNNVYDTGGKMRAIVFVSTSMGIEASKLVDVFDRIRHLEGVLGASLLLGEADMIVIVEVPDISSLSHLIMHKFRSLPEVAGTRTYIAIEDYEYLGYGGGTDDQ